MQKIFLFILFSCTIFSGTFIYEKKKVEVYTIEKDGVVYFDLKTILDNLNLSLDHYREGNSYQIQYLENKLIFAIDSPFVILNDKIQEISKVPLLQDSRVFVPDLFFLGPLSSLLNSNFKIQGKNIILEDKIKKTGPSLYNIEVHNLGFTKAVFYFTENINYSIKEGSHQIALELPKTTTINIGALKINDPFISSISYKGNIVLITLKIEDWSLSHYTLSSPFRIIMDITKSKEKRKIEKEERSEGFKVIIDPGHGGSDIGATGPSGLQEKEVVLKIALYLKDFLKGKGINCLLTREKDEDLSIEERVNFANSHKGDLFISIHNNAFKSKNIKGTETYYLSLQPFEELYKNNNENNQSPSLDLILWDLAQSKYINDSAYLAELIQKELDLLWEIPPRGIKQAPLKILSGLLMPATLVEVGFISNPEEEKVMQKEDFLQKIAQALSKAIIEFKDSIGK
ncbi:MAG: N-acetylmuramoyl-L-alanine amidase, partial [Thermoanaerobaculia bacterium]